MATRKILDTPSIKLEVTDAEPLLHDYGLSKSTWRRAVKIMNHYGAEQALSKIDERANRAFEKKKDLDTARRWRDLITAIHAMVEEEHLPGDKTH